MGKSINHGENNGQAKLTYDAVQIIRHLLRCGHSGKDIATVYGLSMGLISGIRTGKLWVEPEEEVVDKNKFKGRPYRDEDMRIIAEEVTFLMQGGYRAHEKDQVLAGLDIALKAVPSDTWKRWTLTKLMHVIDELSVIGVG